MTQRELRGRLDALPVMVAALLIGLSTKPPGRSPDLPARSSPSA